MSFFENGFFLYFDHVHDHGVQIINPSSLSKDSRTFVYKMAHKIELFWGSNMYFVIANITQMVVGL